MQAKGQLAIFIVITVATIFLLALIIITLLYFYQKRQLTYQKNLDCIKLDFEKDLLKTQVEIQEQTFQYISREIHDNISLALTLAKLNLLTTDVNDHKKLRVILQSSADILGSAITDLNQLSKSMNTDYIKELGLAKAIENEIDKLANIGLLKVNYKINGEPVFLDSEKELVIFRIIQEAFNNVIKHSKATELWLDLNYNTDFLDVVIKDNGRIRHKRNLSTSRKERSRTK